MNKTKENKIRLIGIFSILKIIEIVLCLSIVYCIKYVAIFIEKLSGEPMCPGGIGNCSLGVYYLLGVVLLMFLSIFFVLFFLFIRTVLWGILKDWFSTNWEWSKEINKKYFTTKK